MNHSYETATKWDDILEDEFAKESDRAAAILVCSLFDNALVTLLRNCLVACPTKDDDLIDSPNAPISTFSSRIDLAFRLGLISSKFCRDLHLFRKIRNEFAHNIQGCNFSNSSVHSRIIELAKSSGFIERHPKTRKDNFPSGPRGDFLIISSWMLWVLNEKIESSKSLIVAPEEWGYDSKLNEEELKKLPLPSTA
jgi:DNA-binding MltR family transcriptional regulator